MTRETASELCDETALGARFRRDPAWWAVVALGSRQHWVASLEQLLALGLPVTKVRSRLERGGLHRIHRGVYAIGRPVLSRRGRWLAAVLACGPGAWLSHRSGAALRGVVASDAGPVDVTVTRPLRSRPGIRVHVSRALLERDTDVVDGIPCTALARTLVDLAGGAGASDVARAVARAERLRAFDRGAVEDVLCRSRGRAGAARLRAAVEAWREPPFTRSEAEIALIELIEERGLPRPLVNQTVAGHEVDLWWPDHGLVAELDGYSFHSSRRDFERDRELGLDLSAAGLALVRVSWRQLDRPDRLLERLAAALERSMAARRDRIAAPGEAV